MSIIAKFYPNGEFSQGVDTSGYRPHKYASNQVLQTSCVDADIAVADIDRAAELIADMAGRRYDVCGSRYEDTAGNAYILIDSGEDYCVFEALEENTWMKIRRFELSIHRLLFLGLLRFPLVHQLVESCESECSRKKLVSMTSNMARNIRNGVYLLEQMPGGKDCLSFLTLTLPGLSQDGLRLCCEKWDYMVKRFLDWLRTKIEARNIEFQYVYCTEIQSKRLQQRNEYAPHLHLVFRGRNGKKSPWAITPKQVRRAWKNCIASVTAESFSDVALENIQRIKYSAARYLSKYLTKGSAKIPTDAEGHTIQALRTQWGGMARSLSQSIRRFTHRIGGRFHEQVFLNALLRELPELLKLGYIRYFKDGFVSLGVSRDTGLEYGLRVCTGCLAIPTYVGGLNSIYAHVYACLDRDNY